MKGGSHISPPKTAPRPTRDPGRLTTAGKPFESPGGKRGYTAGNHNPLLVPAKSDQRRTY